MKTKEHVVAFYADDGEGTYDDGNMCINRVCVVDKKRKRINYMYIKEIDYREDINYSLLSKAEFDDLPSKYVKGYKLDSSMTADYAVTK